MSQNETPDQKIARLNDEYITEEKRKQTERRRKIEDRQLAKELDLELSDLK